MKRIKIDTKNNPNFIGCWNIENNSLCDELIELFENNKEIQSKGVSSKGNYDPKIKKSTDITFDPKDLENIKYKILKTYFKNLHECYLDYQEKWPFIKSTFSNVQIDRFNIQKYSPGGHFSKLHSERTSLDTIHRLFAWMTYLNDVDESATTNFDHYGIKIKPETGKTLIWPSEWTHAHTGEVLNNGNKYIITGWMHFPV